MGAGQAATAFPCPSSRFGRAPSPRWEVRPLIKAILFPNATAQASLTWLEKSQFVFPFTILNALLLASLNLLCPPKYRARSAFLGRRTCLGLACHKPMN